ncbi:hypothetical protein KGQ34_00430 [Patescibacteria group bacterium]|nr:hypothetical protein [Patescibacteria group bacterium]
MKTLKKIFLVVVFAVAVFAINFLLDATLYNPAIAVPAYGLLKQYHLISWYERTESLLPFNGGGKDLYPAVSAWKINHSLFFGPRAAVQGVVGAVQKANDGDWHVNIADNAGSALITEFVPEYPLPIPSQGDRITLWGIVRYDLNHRWWEIHPVFGWKKIE